MQSNVCVKLCVPLVAAALGFSRDVAGCVAVMKDIAAWCHLWEATALVFPPAGEDGVLNQICSSSTCQSLCVCFSRRSVFPESTLDQGRVRLEDEEL